MAPDIPLAGLCLTSNLKTLSTVPTQPLFLRLCKSTLSTNTGYGCWLSSHTLPSLAYFGSQFRETISESECTLTILIGGNIHVLSVLGRKILNPLLPTGRTLTIVLYPSFL